MTDFLIQMMVNYPWFAWLLVAFAAVGVGYGSLWLAGGVTFVSAWMGYRRAVWKSKAAVRRQLLEDGAYDCAVCASFEAEYRDAMGPVLGDDPPEYLHPDGDDDELLPEPDEDKVLAFLHAVKLMGMLNDDDQLPGGPSRCTNRDCYRYGEPHGGACDVAPTMPAACYTESCTPRDQPEPWYLTDPAGPAGPPVPWSNFEAAFPLHAAIRSDLRAAGFGGHEYAEEVAESAYTAAQAREVQAMVTDGVITSGGQENGHDN